MVGSTCSMLSYTGYAAYAPSKYAVKGLADGLRLELQRNNIHVGCVYPPNMDTPCLKKENETKPAEGLFVEKYLESLFSPADIASKTIRHIKRGDPHIYCDLDAWGVTLTSCNMGPHNNIFTSILFVIPAIVFTNIFRLILLGIYKMKRFTGAEREKKWTAGTASQGTEESIYTSISLVCNKETAFPLVEETNDLSTHMLALSLLMVHNSHGGGQHNMSELTARKEVTSPHLNFVHLDIEARRNATTLVQTTIQIHNHLSGTMIINHSDFTNVTYSITSHIQSLTLLLHALKELQKHLRARTNENLTFTTLLSVGNGLKSVGKDIHQHGWSII